jgi:hypothetical protein
LVAEDEGVGDGVPLPVGDGELVAVAERLPVAVLVLCGWLVGVELGVEVREPVELRVDFAEAVCVSDTVAVAVSTAVGVGVAEAVSVAVLVLCVWLVGVELGVEVGEAQYNRRTTFPPTKEVKLFASCVISLVVSARS